ncbi:MAG TPA: DUF6391 domain-containing protein [Kofleriaceae bacterium]|nr:DUF6391 domain-containing protein [Kofleriaceae bacterium]
MLVVTVVIVWIIDGRDRRLGISHGIEHATIALLERLIRFGLGGFATPDSFVVRIPRESVHLLWRERVRDAAQRAIDQLAAGDRQLAYTPDCSTNWFAERAILCVCVFAFCAFAYVVSAPPHVGVLAVATAIWFARALGHVLGIALQWWVTVHTRWASVRIVDVEVGEGKDDHAGTYEFRVRLDIVPRPG